MCNRDQRESFVRQAQSRKGAVRAEFTLTWRYNADSQSEQADETSVQEGRQVPGLLLAHHSSGLFNAAHGRRDARDVTTMWDRITVARAFSFVRYGTKL